ncbi:MAG: cyclic nucleotide-binding domain-containing protein [Synechococcus sp.]
MPLSALFQGLLAASSLLLGSLLGLVWRPRRALSAAVMAFGSGTLISAIAFEIALPVFEANGVLPIAIGFCLGGGCFTLATQYVDRLGGFLRHPANRRRFLFHRRQEEAETVLSALSHIRVLQEIPPEEAQAIVGMVQEVSVPAGQVLFEQGDMGDWLGMIASGEATVEVDNTTIANLDAGEVFGEMALLTGEPRSATVVAKSGMNIFRLDRPHFDKLIARSPHLASSLSRVLARRLQTTNTSRVRAEANLAAWRQQAIDSIELDLSPAEEQQMARSLATSSAPLAIFVGTMLDNIPEAIVLGMATHTPSTGTAFLLAVFISNLPESLTSSIGMRQAGYSIRKILGLWSSQVILVGACALGGSLLVNAISPATGAVIQSVSGGAVLAMLASTMMPEAFELGGGVVSLATIAGFLISFILSASQLN